MYFYTMKKHFKRLTFNSIFKYVYIHVPFLLCDIPEEKKEEV